jgi:hypothetical protein
MPADHIPRFSSFDMPAAARTGQARAHPITLDADVLKPRLPKGDVFDGVAGADTKNQMPLDRDHWC